MQEDDSLKNIKSINDFGIELDKEKLIPAIIQDYETNKVLMLAYMNAESIGKSLETKHTWFYSRERKKLWNKGETSGNTQEIKEMYFDCDEDTLLVLVKQKGPACHTGQYSCFFNKIEIKDFNNRSSINDFILKLKFKYLSDIDFKILNELLQTVKERIKDKKEESYTYKLHNKGIDEILKKIGEESIEIILAAKHQKKEQVIYETADFLYHLTVLMAEKDISFEDILNELKKRRK